MKHKLAEILVWSAIALGVVWVVVTLAGCRSLQPDEVSLTYGVGSGSLHAGPDRARYDEDSQWVAGTLTWYVGARHYPGIEPSTKAAPVECERRCK